MKERIANMGRLAEIADDLAASPGCEPWRRDWFKQRAQAYREEQAAQIARREADGAPLEMDVEHGAGYDAEGAYHDPDGSTWPVPWWQAALVLGCFVLEIGCLIVLWLWCKRKGWL